MDPKKFKTWLFSAVVLFLMVLAADFYVLHLYFPQTNEKNETTISEATQADASGETPTKVTDSSFLAIADKANAQPAPENNFLDMLKACSPEIAAQAIATPEALVAYLSKSVGVAREVISIENYHLKMADGSVHRVHILDTGDNEHNTKEVRYFTLDEEGYPVRDYENEKLGAEKLLSQGTTIRYEAKSTLHLKDSSTLDLEKHDTKVHQIQYRAHGKTLSCFELNCQCQ